MVRSLKPGINKSFLLGGSVMVFVDPEPTEVTIELLNQNDFIQSTMRLKWLLASAEALSRLEALTEQAQSKRFKPAKIGRRLF
jgi:hypothetical protein